MDLDFSLEVDYFVAEEPLESVNGDVAFVNADKDQLFFGIVDGAGHGPEAHAVAEASRKFLERYRNMELPPLMEALHKELRGTRGGVAIIGRLDVRKLQLNYVGIGNISLRKFGKHSQTELTQGGIIGYQIRTPKEKVIQLLPDDVIVMHTDGITSHFDINDYPQLLRDCARTIAENMLKKFSKNNDDSTCLVMRFN
ncbi:MAG: serine phosphatase RsbU (regulator of sigma subunit) [Pseudohongiellaceae bacterium]|jgi:serine phosphatase RsbU (regulator of sigma subunit)